MQPKDPMIRIIQKKLAIPNINIYFGQSNGPWSVVEGVLLYDKKPYILETLQAYLLEKNYDNPLAGHFGVKRLYNSFHANTIGLRWELLLRNMYMAAIFTWGVKHKDTKFMAICNHYLFLCISKKILAFILSQDYLKAKTEEE